MGRPHNKGLHLGPLKLGNYYHLRLYRADHFERELGLITVPKRKVIMGTPLSGPVLK